MPYKDPDIQRKFVREWVAQRRAEYLRNRKCEQCRRAPATAFIAQDGKTFNHRCWSWEIHRRNMELLNAWCVCEPCRQKMLQEQYFKKHPAPHGTEKRYNRGCFCGPCKDAHNKANLERKKKRRAVA